MNIGELKSQIMNLAFEEHASMQEYSQIVLDAVNRGIQIIHSTVRPILGRLEIVQPAKAGESKLGASGGQEGGARRQPDWIRYDMKELTSEDGSTTFMDFANQVTLETEEGRYLPSVPYRTEGRQSLLLRGSDRGTFSVWYKRIPQKVTAETSDTQELELDYDVQQLLPLLSAFYVWLDDDERKAAIYYNQYEDLKQQLQLNSRKRASATIVSGREGRL